MVQLLWTQKQDIGPAPRRQLDMVYDVAHKTVVLFGGFDTEFTNDTWEWNGETWTQVQDIGPSARSQHSMAYDSVRGRVVLFGGFGTPGSFGDTWEWDGADWTQVADTGPQARLGHAMTFDTARNRTILFGGAATGAGTLVANTTFGDTWTWDGNEWIQELDAGPRDRCFCRIAYDAKRDRVVLFGGHFFTPRTGRFPLNNYMNDTWEYDGTRWTHLADTGPEPRSFYGLAYDGAETLLFGGFGSGGANSVTANSVTWSWDGKFWTQRQDMGPSARWGMGMAHDSGRSRTVLFGGQNDKSGANLGDTWELFSRLTLSPDR